MLLTHTSGIHDTYARVPHHQEVSPPAYNFAGPSLRDAITAFVTPAGRYFTKKSFGAAAPGARSDYSSIGTAAAALVADAHAEGGLAAYTRSSLFVPLGMESTAWRLAELAPSRELPLAVPYVSREARGGPPAVRFMPAISEQTFWPGASLKTTALDYARFVAALADGQLLAPGTMAEVLRVQYPAVDPDRGLILAWSTRAGVRVVFHDGQNDGFRSTMFFTPHGTTVDGAVYGVVVLTNGDAAVGGVPLEAKLGSELLARAMNGTLLPR
jgi:CubicO group peptidase (beta-lactamase class C family)